MLIPWRKDIIRLRARIIKNMLAMISLTVMFSACGSGNSDNDNSVNEDSLKQVREQEKLDSIAKSDSKYRADSLEMVAADSIRKADSLKNAQNQIPVQPVIDPTDYPQTEYGVVFPYDEEEYPIGKYGGPVPKDIM